VRHNSARTQQFQVPRGAASVSLAQDEVLVLGGIRDDDGLHDAFVVIDPRDESQAASTEIDVERAVVGIVVGEMERR